MAIYLQKVEKREKTTTTTPEGVFIFVSVKDTLSRKKTSVFDLSR
jgi:hypothetical protein